MEIGLLLKNFCEDFSAMFDNVSSISSDLGSSIFSFEIEMINIPRIKAPLIKPLIHSGASIYFLTNKSINAPKAK